jgi:hypothetical protein
MICPCCNKELTPQAVEKMREFLAAWDAQAADLGALVAMSGGGPVEAMYKEQEAIAEAKRSLLAAYDAEQAEKAPV